VWGSGQCWYGGVVAYSSGYSEESLASCVAVEFPAESTLLKKVNFAEGAVVLLAGGRVEREKQSRIHREQATLLRTIVSIAEIRRMMASRMKIRSSDFIAKNSRL